MINILGWNIMNFDLPFLAQSSIYNGVKIPWAFRIGHGKNRYYNDMWVDMMQLMGGGDFRFMLKLETCARACGFKGGKTGKGADFYKMSKDDQKDYLSADLDMTEAIFRKLAKTHDFGENSIIFDIETAPLSIDELEAIAPKFDPSEVKTGNLKDEFKIQDKIEKAEMYHYVNIQKSAGLHAHYAKPIAIGYADMATGDQNLVLSDSPKFLLEDFWQRTESAWKENRKYDI